MSILECYAQSTIMKKIILFILVLITYATVFAQTVDCPSVTELKALYKGDKDFRATVDNMFKNIHPLEGDAPNPWQGKGVDDLYAFINEWFYFLPDAHNGLDRILKFTFLFYKNPDGMEFILGEKGKAWALSFVEERGKYLDSPASTSIIERWLNDPALKNDEFVNPKEGFTSFNDFFIRDLKPGARPIDGVDDPSALVSPADGIINMINNQLDLETQIPTKSGMTLSLNELLDNSAYAKNFVGGTALAVFLMPYDYHHYHAPTEGIIVESKETVGDRLFGMPDMLDMINDGNVAYNKDYSVFQNFKHGYFIIQTTRYGYIAMIPIGLQTVGSVVFEEKFKAINSEAGVAVQKGEKLGHFAYGGSTVLLLFEKGTFSSLTVKQGQQIGTLSTK